MYSFKKSLIALVGLLVLVGGLAALLPLIGRGQGGGNNPLTRDPRRSFYLTQTTHNGSQALTACAEGYHMASLWEILDPSNLKYNTELGMTRADSGSGPPQDSFGWVRTGRDASNENCEVWTTDDFEQQGRIADLLGPSSFTLNVSPWESGPTGCASNIAVWCVQD